MDKTESSLTILRRQIRELENDIKVWEKKKKIAKDQDHYYNALIYDSEIDNKNLLIKQKTADMERLIAESQTTLF